MAPRLSPRPHAPRLRRALRAAGAATVAALLALGGPGAALAAPGDPDTGVTEQLQQQRGVRAFLDENGNGAFDDGETLVPNINLEVGICFEDGAAYDCKHGIYDGVERTGTAQEASGGNTTSSGYVSVGNSNTTWLNWVPFTGSKPPMLGDLKLHLPKGYTSPLATDGTVSVKGVQDGQRVDAGPALTPGYFVGRTFLTDEARKNPRSLDWQMLDVPLTKTAGVNELDAQAPTVEAMRTALKQGFNTVQLGTLAFDDANGDGVLDAKENLVEGVPVSTTSCSVPSTGGETNCGDNGSSYSSYNGSLLGNDLESSLTQNVEQEGWDQVGDKINLFTWISKAHTGTLPPSITVTKRPADWRDTPFASRFDAQGAYTIDGDRPMDTLTPASRATLPLRVGYFNGAHFVSDPKASNPRSQLWFLPTLGLRIEDAPDSTDGAVKDPSEITDPPRWGTVPGFRVFMDGDRDGVWNPQQEELIDDLPISLESCARGLASEAYSCENLSAYNAASSARGIIRGAYGAQGGDLWNDDIPHFSQMGFDPDVREKVGAGGLRYIPAGLEVTTKDAKGAPHLRTSWADEKGMIAEPTPTDNWEIGHFIDHRWYSVHDYDSPDTKIWQFYNIGLRPKALEVSVQACSEGSGATQCPRSDRATLTVTNHTGLTHTKIAPTLTATVGGKAVTATCPAIASLKDGEHADCTVGWEAPAGAETVTAHGSAASTMRFDAKDYRVKADEASDSRPLEAAVAPSASTSPSTPATPSTSPSASTSATPSTSSSPSTSPVPSASETSTSSPGQPGPSGSASRTAEPPAPGPSRTPSPGDTQGPGDDGPDDGSRSPLPRTGAQVIGAAAAGIVLVAIGLLLVTRTRRRR